MSNDEQNSGQPDPKFLTRLFGQGATKRAAAQSEITDTSEHQRLREIIDGWGKRKSGKSDGEHSR